MTTIQTYKLLEDSCFVFLARVIGVDGDPVQQADVSTITRTVWDVTAGAAVTGHDGASETVASVIFDDPTVKTNAEDSLWPYTDTTKGYNFKTTVASTAIETGAGNEYSVEFNFTDANSNVFKVVFRVSALDAYAT